MFMASPRVYGTLAQDVDFETMNHLGCYPYSILIIELLLERSRESLRSIEILFAINVINSTRRVVH